MCAASAMFAFHFYLTFIIIISYLNLCMKKTLTHTPPMLAFVVQCVQSNMWTPSTLSCELCHTHLKSVIARAVAYGHKNPIWILFCWPNDEYLCSLLIYAHKSHKLWWASFGSNECLLQFRVDFGHYIHSIQKVKYFIQNECGSINQMNVL